MRSFPTVPHPKRTFKLEIQRTSFMNASSDTRHAAENEGKYPHLFLLENTVDPSARIVAVNK